MASNYRGVPIPSDLDAQWVQNGISVRRWKEGVDAALSSRPDGTADTGVLKITGWSRTEVRVFAHLSADEPDKARRLVQDMRPADRAVLSFHLSELSRIVEDEEDDRRRTDRLSRTHGG